MRSNFLPFAAPLIGDDDVAEVVDTLRSNWLTTGPKVRRFEEQFMAAVDAPAALALNSCTSALHMALKVLGVGPGDAVITTPLTFCSGVNVIEHVGALPILVDVQPDTLNIDPERIREVLETWDKNGTGIQIRAVIPVHLYGHPCDLDPIVETAREHDLAIIDDAAHALPARYKGRPIGSYAASCPVPILTCFSFYAIKNMTTAEGGMLVGNTDLIDDARLWSLHGMSRDALKRYQAEGPWYYEVVHPGFKYNMTDIQAALGLHQLAQLPAFHTRRQEIAKRYTQAFSRVEALQVPKEEGQVDHAWHLYVIRLQLDRLDIDRAGFIEALRQRNIGTSVHFIPIHLHEYYRRQYGYRPEDFRISYQEYQRIVSLPLYPKMSDQDVEDVIAAVCELVKQHRRGIG